MVGQIISRKQVVKGAEKLLSASYQCHVLSRTEGTYNKQLT